MYVIGVRRFGAERVGRGAVLLEEKHQVNFAMSTTGGTLPGA